MLNLPADEQYVVLVNGVGAELDQRLEPGDMVAVFQSIAGGSLGGPSSTYRSG
jgi:sulfur carrier protein ThiS